MKTYPTSSLCIAFLAPILLAANAFAQVPTPSPRPPGDEDVVKISTSLIQIDVSVTDAKGNVVTGLKPEDFEIFENGEKQKISHFSFVPALETAAEVKDRAPEQPTVPVPQATLRPEQIRRTIALVVDDLSLSFESTYQVRRSLKKYVDEQVQDGDLVAIIRTGAGIGALQQFTYDKRLLYAAIERIRFNPIGNGKIGAFAPIEPTPLQQRQAAGDDSITAEDLASERDSINAFNDFQSSVFATGTLGALRYIVTGMGELPGRKSVVLFSEGFRLLERDSTGVSTGGRVLDFLKRLVDQANRSSVVFYTIDARGLQTLAFTAQDQIVDASPDAMNTALSDRREELFETQAGLDYLADETGGFAVKNNNDISGGLRRVLKDQSYYLIAYEPDTDTFDPVKRRFNRLDVKVNRPDVKVRYRSGFFNVPDRNVAKASTFETPVQQIQAALTSPFAVNGITLKMSALFGSDPGNTAFVRSLLHIDASDLKFRDLADGSKEATFDVLAASFGDNGQIVEQLGKTYTMTTRGDAYKRIIAEGFVYHFTFPVKKPGAYQYRVAIRDHESGKVGSASQFVEVPNLKKGRLNLSSIVIEDLTAEQWAQMSTPGGQNISGDAMKDTALKRAKLGSVLRYGYEIYNAKLAPGPNLTVKVRIFRDGKLILDGKENPLPLTGQTDLKRIKVSGALSLGKQMEAGDHILQIIVTDNQAKARQNIATQYIQFEVIP